MAVIMPITKSFPMPMIQALKLISKLKEAGADYNVSDIHPYNGEFAELVICKEEETGEIVYMFYSYTKKPKP